jgi:hypothetical protein
MDSLDWLSDAELLTRLKALARQERDATARLIAHLALVDARRLYLPEGCSSMFTYCTEVLHYSEGAAYARIEVARAVRRFPLILERLAEGSLNLTTVRLLSPHLTGANHRDALDAAAHGSRRQVEELVARLRPLPPVAATIRKLPAPETAVRTPREGLSFELTPPLDTGSAPASAGSRETVAADTPTADTSASRTSTSRHPAADTSALRPSAAAVSHPSHRAVILPLAPEYYRLQVTLRAETHARLRQAQELMRHQIPNGDPAEILDRALKDLVEKLSRRKFAALTRSRASGG